MMKKKLYGIILIKQKKTSLWFYRDYVVGLSSHDYILHFDFDTLYSPNTIKGN